jgi:hypothetical protein
MPTTNVTNFRTASAWSNLQQWTLCRSQDNGKVIGPRFDDFETIVIEGKA